MRPSTDRAETFYFITFIIAILIILLTLLAGIGIIQHPFIDPLKCVLFPNTNATGSGVC